jgi:hypothetical protein
MKIPSKIKHKIKDHAAEKVSIILLMLVLIIACEKENDLPEYNPPADHTVNEDGFMHKSGLNQPLANCVGCHGSDLKGGTTGVSCYECHGQKW